MFIIIDWIVINKPWIQLLNKIFYPQIGGS